jgi:hypothetical protein
MAMLRSTVVLFLLDTALATAILWVLMVGFGCLDPAWRPESIDDLWLVIRIAEIALISSVGLLFLAWRGRYQMLSDGIALMTISVLGFCYFGAIQGALAPRQYQEMSILIWGGVGLSLGALVPAHVLTFLVLRRTPLLSGPVPKAA